YLCYLYTLSFVSLFCSSSLFFFFNDTSPTELYTLSLHDALPISAGGLMMPIAMALIFNSFRKGERGLAVGLYGIAAMVAPAIGRTVGGIDIEFFIWPFLFLFNIPFAVTGIFFCIGYLRQTERNEDLKFDFIGFILITIGVGSILYALDRGLTLDLLLSPQSITLHII